MLAKWIFLLLAAISSGISISLMSVSIATENWVVAEAMDVNGINKNSAINYGLFRGILTRNHLATPRYLDLNLICDYQANKCVYSCHQDPTEIQKDIQNLLVGEKVSECPFSNRRSAFIVDGNSTGEALDKSPHDGFINAGLLLAVFVTLSISMCFELFALIQTILCIFYSSPHSMLNIFGIYIWNGAALFFTTLTLILYGSLFASSIINNVAIADTLGQHAEFTSEGLASLGFSYWILFAPLVMHLMNIALLKYRTILINKSDPIPVMRIDRSDTNLMVY